MPLVVGIVLVVGVLVAAGAILLGGGDDDGSADPDDTSASGASDHHADDSGAIDTTANTDSTGSSDSTQSTQSPDGGPVADESGGGGGGGGGDNHDIGEAEAVVRRYFAAVLDKDCQSIVDAVTESTWSAEAASAEEAVAACQRAVDAGRLDFEGSATLDALVVVDQADDRITFEATETIGGEQLRENFLVVDEAGDWKVDLSGS